MMMCPMGPAQSVGMLLISLGIGYFVCAEAEKHKEGFVKQLGYWIGSIIIVLSVIAALRGLCFNIYHKMVFHKSPPSAKMCPGMTGRMMHPR